MSHYKDARRLAMTGFILGRFKIRTWVETGALEGESCWFWSRWVHRAIGCELDESVVRRVEVRHRGTNVRVVHGRSPDWLKNLEVTSPVFFYLDCNWCKESVLEEELKTIRGRWIDYVVLANGLPIGSNPNFKGDECVSEPAEKILSGYRDRYTQILIPNYSAPEKGNPSGPWAGYAILNPSWDRIPHDKDWIDLCA